MRLGFAKADITPRVGVELSGFGPFLLRRSIGVRDPLWARAMAVEHGGRRFVLVECDLIGAPMAITTAVRQRVAAAAGLPPEATMVHCIHTHSGPSLRTGSGWGEADLAYVETLPARIAKACLGALANLREATLAHGEAACEGIGLNRVYDRDAPPLEEVLRDDWRPARPELTDTRCHVLKAEAGGKVIGFLSYFGCHPVTCCQETRYIHGDYAGVATNHLEREVGGVGIFLQGAEGDVNSCCVHKPETESLRALDIIAGRYARAVRAALAAARPVEVTSVAGLTMRAPLKRRKRTREELLAELQRHEAVTLAPEASETDFNVRMAVVRAIGLRRAIEGQDAGKDPDPPVEVQGLRIGPVAFLGAPFEVFQAIKNDVVRAAKSPIPLVMALVNDALGYAVDDTAAAKGGYEANLCPFENIHKDLSAALLALDARLWEA